MSFLKNSIFFNGPIGSHKNRIYLLSDHKVDPHLGRGSLWWCTSHLPDNTRPDLLITLGVLIFMGIKQVLIVVIRFVFTLWLLTVVMYIPRGSRLSQHDIKCIRQLDVVLPVVACLQCWRNLWTSSYQCQAL